MGAADVVAWATRIVAMLPERRDDALAVLNGAVGDRLEDAGSSLALPMTFHVRPNGPALSDDTVPRSAARPRACLLVHGLMGSDRAWGFGDESGGDEYGAAVAAARDVTPVYVRYNTGRHISVNGRELASRLEALFSTWPELTDVSIVAHSMGGLVTRSACHYAAVAGHTWPDKLRRVFLLGVPSYGARWEQLAHVAAFTLDAIWNPWTKLIGKAINMRSVGIKDLRHGFVLDEDWRHRDLDELRLAVPRRPLDPSKARWYVAAATLGESRGPVASLLGDGLVHPASAGGQGLGSPPEGIIPSATVRVFDETSHIALMRDPAVLDQILDWWEQS